MQMLSFSLAHSTHLPISHSLFFCSLCLCLLPPFFAYLCNTIKNFVKRIMHERATARRAVQGRRREGGLLDQWQWPSAWGRRAERGERGCLCLLCMKFTWFCFKFVCLAYYCHTCWEHPLSPHLSLPGMQQTVTKLWWKRKGRGNRGNLMNKRAEFVWVRKVYQTDFCVNSQFIYVNLMEMSV